MIRVFPNSRRQGKPLTKWTPVDDLAFYGDPPLPHLLPPEMPVKISTLFTWDVPEGERLKRAWGNYYSDVQIGGPAFNDPGDNFEPGIFVKQGVVFTSRGCPYSCPWCFVPAREGDIKELVIKQGYIIEDNNLLACSRPHIEAVFEMLSRQPQAAEFAGGLDAKLLSSWHVDLLKSIRIGQMWFSCDTPEAISNIERISGLLKDFSEHKKRCYVLVGFNGETIQEADKRLRKVYSLGFLPFAMFYRSIGSGKRDHKEWSKFLKYWCRPAAYKSNKLSSWMDL